MPIAGSNVEAVPMRIIDNRLIEYAKQRIPSHMAVDAVAALDGLRRGEKVCLRLYGSNVSKVRSACAVEGVEVSE